MADEGACCSQWNRGSHLKGRAYNGPPFAYVRGVQVWRSLESELRGQLWFNYFGRLSLSPFAMPRVSGSIGWRRDRPTIFHRPLR
jgi:hypothetical protein